MSGLEFAVNRRQVIKVSGALAMAVAGGAIPAGALPGAAPGLFATQADLARARRNTSGLAGFLALVDAQGRGTPPFIAREMQAIEFGWPNAPAPPGTTLAQAVRALEAGSDEIRNLALAFALTGAKRHARNAEARLLDWARRHTVVNFYDFDPDFRTGTHDGWTEGFNSARPWNFGLDSTWQAYGLANAADALLLLRAGGHAFAADAQRDIDDWMLRLTEGVNAGLHAWTRWADANEAGATGSFHATSAVEGTGDLTAGVRRHRADNHLTWALCGLLAAGIAMQDGTLVDYALTGGAWFDRRAGAYRNPSPIREVIRLAVEIERPVQGRVFEERIERSPRIGYALFHLEGMMLAARMAWVHGKADFFMGDPLTAPRLLAAHRRYAPFVSGSAASPDPAEAAGVNARWLAALSPEAFGGETRSSLIAARPLQGQWRHMVGPAALLFGGP